MQPLYGTGTFFSVSELSGLNLNISGHVFLVMFSGFSGLSGWKGFVFLADIDLAAILDLAFYLKEPLIFG